MPIPRLLRTTISNTIITSISKSSLSGRYGKSQLQIRKGFDLIAVIFYLPASVLHDTHSILGKLVLLEQRTHEQIWKGPFKMSKNTTQKKRTNFQLTELEMRHLKGCQRTYMYGGNLQSVESKLNPAHPGDNMNMESVPLGVSANTRSCRTI